MRNKPLRALRRFCLDCQGEDKPSVTACRDDECFFYAWRWLAGGCGPDAQNVEATAQNPWLPAENPLRVIRRFCLACGGSRAEVRNCDAKNSCPLWSYRFGVLPSTFRRVFARRRKNRSALTLPGL